jgi:hypothetical protein
MSTYPQASLVRPIYGGGLGTLPELKNAIKRFASRTFVVYKHDIKDLTFADFRNDLDIMRFQQE